jgi:hypothetical protein
VTKTAADPRQRATEEELYEAKTRGAFSMTHAKVFVVSLMMMAASAFTAGHGAAQVPMPQAKTPTLQGGTPLNGSALGAQVGYAALRADFFHGDGNWDVGVSLGAPTFGERWLHGYNQSLGVDLRVPFRIRLAQWRRGNGSLKLGPYFHVGRAFRGGPDCAGPGCRPGGCVGAGCACPGPGCPAPRDCRAGDCDRNWEGLSVGTGILIGFVGDVALPKLFKLIFGVEQQLGFLHLRDEPSDYRHDFMAAATWLDLGLEAFWRDAIFFTMVMNVGAQYGSDSLHYADHALFRQLFGVAYKFR